MIGVIVPSRQDHLQLDPLHEARSVRSHDGIPLQEGSDQQITEIAAVVRKGQIVARIDIEAGDRQHEVQTPFAAQQQFLVGRIEQLRQTDVDIHLGLFESANGRQTQIVAVGILETALAVDLEVLLGIPTWTGRRSTIEEAGEAEIHGRQVIGRYHGGRGQRQGGGQGFQSGQAHRKPLVVVLGIERAER
jgi:hypothetical protein